eukprot:TRINITY_DN64036_c0_g1_i1.p1 TRINITY_DN64036_c0_g1~~TRINITY_DN64036_c0_g1_i1.p1  ORF type:complete len:668 (-),score=125.40 TRINITY_DN64036_c0_g1_i1:93-2096(-)
MRKLAALKRRALVLALLLRSFLVLGRSSNASARSLGEAEAWGDMGHCAQHYSVSDVQELKDFMSPSRWLSATNYYRSCHGSPPLVWDEELLPFARAWVEKLLTHCRDGPDMVDWVKAGGSNTERPHDPKAYSEEQPQQAENIDARQWYDAEDPEWKTVRDWYNEVEACPGQGNEPGCGGDLNHYTALVWRDARRMACYVGRRDDLRVVSCRYAAAADRDGMDCDVPNTWGPPGSAGCEMGDGSRDGRPEVPALVKDCPTYTPTAATSESHTFVHESHAESMPALVSDGGRVSCVLEKSLGRCERCLTSEQCGGDRYCCPFMKKCIMEPHDKCSAPIAFCQPPCGDDRIDDCHCRPKLTQDTFPDEWQSPTCRAGEEPKAVAPLESRAPAFPKSTVNLAFHKSDASCIVKGQLRACERCLHNEQCEDGHYCCPFMKKCVKDGGEKCSLPIAFCQPPCMDFKAPEDCSCKPKGTQDAFPEEWQSPLCKDGEEPFIVKTTPKPHSPPLKLSYRGIRNAEEYQRLVEFVSSHLEQWKVSRFCTNLDASKASPEDEDFSHGTAHIVVQFNGILDHDDSDVFSFESLTPELDHIDGRSELEANCDGTAWMGNGLAQRWSGLPSKTRIGFQPQAVLLLLAGCGLAALAIPALLRRRRGQMNGGDSDEAQELLVE